VFCCKNLVSFGRNPSTTYVFQGEFRLCLLPIGIFIRFEETHVPLKRNPSMLEAAASSTLFPSENGVSFERNASCNVGFPEWR
jgi:hypothetical protein